MAPSGGPDPREGASVGRVRAALAAAGSEAEITLLAEAARSAGDAAASLGCPLVV